MCSVCQWGDAGKAQLWGLLVVAAVDPRLGPENGADGGELVEVESRQLGGIEGRDPEASGSAVEGDGKRSWGPFGYFSTIVGAESTVVGLVCGESESAV